MSYRKSEHFAIAFLLVLFALAAVALGVTYFYQPTFLKDLVYILLGLGVISIPVLIYTVSKGE